ncbi:unnamed protein product [Bemisia tabaci]|uniref:C2H2-type domain-containing protein n=1 Tax=Bemisia tabaci TaxID=7038 RepID=A0A9P0A028_BEMTA|nr:unnamed protein product [Bemisia tabaci]
MTLSKVSPSAAKPFSCDLCQEKCYARKESLYRHQTFECPNNIERLSFPCMFCSHIAKQKTHLERHLRVVHKLRPHDIPKDLLHPTSVHSSSSVT